MSPIHSQSIFAGCSDSCGWIAAIVASISFGSYGVTIKESGKKNVDADPLILQVKITASIHQERERL